MKHTIGLIGFGYIGSGYHYPTYCREDVPFDITAVYDIRPERRAEAGKNGLKVFDTLESFLASRLFELVVIATPNNVHCPLALAAMEAGYHVMVEKPAALTSAELETMIECSKKTGKLFTVHHNRRFDRDFLIVKEALREGRIGKPFCIESRIHANVQGGGTDSVSGWRAFPDHGGGMFFDWGVHMLDQILYLIDEPVVSVYADIYALHGKQVDDHSKIVLTFSSGLCAQVEVSMFTSIKLPRWYILGDEGALMMQEVNSPGAVIRHVDKAHHYTGLSDAYTLDTVEKREETAYIIDEVTEYTYPDEDHMPPQDWASLYKNLAGVLDGTEELIVKPEGVLRCFKVIEAAFLSAKEHRSVSL